MRHLDDVFRYAMARLGSREEAEDVAIETVQALPNPCHRRELRAYMVGVARRKIADRLRRRRPTQPVRKADAVVRFDGVADEAATLEAALDRLSPEHRELLVLKYALGFSSEEIGRAIGKRPPAVDSALQRARAAFGAIWKEMG
jgi:RNA polymerase sigma-70 factor, ECF subfamily